MDGYFPDSLRVYCVIEEVQVEISWQKLSALQIHVSVMWLFLAGWVDLDISKDRSPFIFKFQELKDNVGRIQLVY